MGAKHQVIARKTDQRYQKHINATIKACNQLEIGKTIGDYAGDAKKGVDAKDDEEGEQRITARSDDRIERSH